jgi:hypothetical protein
MQFYKNFSRVLMDVPDSPKVSNVDIYGCFNFSFELFIMLMIEKFVAKKSMRIPMSLMLSLLHALKIALVQCQEYYIEN